MNIKSLLLGSAAAMVAVSGAQAADAIVVEPEPVEYVRVCDAYGTGFFFIPGTETCIRFSGYIRSSYEKTSLDRTVIDANPLVGTTAGGVAASLAAGFSDELNFTFWGQRARLNIDTRNETDWGTLRAVYRLEGGDSNVDADIDMDVALISLAGFRAGFAGANYWTSNHGFAGVNFTGLGAAFTPATDEGWYGFDDATIFDYTWAADGFSVTIGVEDPRLAVGGGFGNATNAGGPDSRANFYAGFNYQGDGFGVAFTAVHDSTAVDLTVPVGTGDVGGWAYKVSVDLDLSDFIPGGILHGMYMDDGDYQTDYVHNWNGLWNPENIWQISFQADLSPEVQFVAQYSAAEGSAIGVGTVGGGLPAGAGFSEGDAWNASVGLNWFPAAAPGFSLRGSYKFGEFENAVRFGTQTAGFVDEDYDGFFVSVRRDF